MTTKTNSQKKNYHIPDGNFTDCEKSIRDSITSDINYWKITVTEDLIKSLEKEGDIFNGKVTISEMILHKLKLNLMKEAQEFGRKQGYLKAQPKGCKQEDILKMIDECDCDELYRISVKQLKQKIKGEKTMTTEFNLSYRIDGYDPITQLVVRPDVKKFIKLIEKIAEDARLYADMDEEDFWKSSTISPEDASKRAFYYEEFLNEILALAGSDLSGVTK